MSEHINNREYRQCNFIGTLEYTQNIAPIQAIEGEKRLISE